MSQKTSLLVFGVFNLALAIFASGVERWFPKLVSPMPGDVCYSRGLQSPLVFGTILVLFAASAVFLSFIYAQKLWPYRFGEAYLAQDKQDGWRHWLPFFWLWNLYALTVSLWRLFEFSGCESTSMPDFARWMMFNDMPGTILLIPIMTGGLALYAGYLVLGFACRLFGGLGGAK